MSVQDDSSTRSWQTIADEWVSHADTNDYRNEFLMPIMLAMVGHDHRPAAFLVYLWLAAEHQRNKAAVRISYQDLAEAIGISRSSVQAAISWLTRRQLLTARKENATAVPAYTLLHPWRKDFAVKAAPGLRFSCCRKPAT